MADSLPSTKLTAIFSTLEALQDDNEQLASERDALLSTRGELEAKLAWAEARCAACERERDALREALLQRSGYRLAEDGETSFVANQSITLSGPLSSPRRAPQRTSNAAPAPDPNASLNLDAPSLLRQLSRLASRTEAEWEERERVLLRRIRHLEARLHALSARSPSPRADDTQHIVSPRPLRGLSPSKTDPSRSADVSWLESRVADRSLDDDAGPRTPSSRIHSFPRSHHCTSTPRQQRQPPPPASHSAPSAHHAPRSSPRLTRSSPSAHPPPDPLADVSLISFSRSPSPSPFEARSTPHEFTSSPPSSIRPTPSDTDPTELPAIQHANAAVSSLNAALAHSQAQCTSMQHEIDMLRAALLQPDVDAEPDADAEPPPSPPPPSRPYRPFSASSLASDDPDEDHLAPSRIDDPGGWLAALRAEVGSSGEDEAEEVEVPSAHMTRRGSVEQRDPSREQQEGLPAAPEPREAGNSVVDARTYATLQQKHAALLGAFEAIIAENVRSSQEVFRIVREHREGQ